MAMGSGLCEEELQSETKLPTTCQLEITANTGIQFRLNWLIRREIAFHANQVNDTCTAQYINLAFIGFTCITFCNTENKISLQIMNP